MSSLIDPTRVKVLRKARGWNQIDLSKHSKVDKSIISRIERGFQADYRVSVVVKLAKSLNVPVDSLIVSEEPRETEEMIPEVADMIYQLKKHDIKVQHQVVTITRAFLSTIEEYN